jgi:head-tail adaptor
MIDAGDLNRRIRFERKVPPSGFTSAGKEAWVPVATVSAQIRDVLPSRSERFTEGMTMETRPSRVRIRYRKGITSDMRLLVGRMVAEGDAEPVWHTDRVMQIIAGPVELGDREGMEIMAEDYSTTGGQA